MAEALNSPYGNRPDSLNSPVPDEGNFMQQLGQIRVPQGPNDPSLVPQNQPQTVTPPQDPDASLQKIDPMEAEIDAILSQQGAQDAPTVPKPSFGEMTTELGPVEALRRSVLDTQNRMKLSFAKTDWEKAKFLENIYGAENVRMKNGAVEFRRKGDKGFRKLDDDTIEYIDDAMDFSRDVYEMGAEALTRGAIGLGTGLATANPALGVGATALSGALGAGAAFGAGEVQARELGIPLDPKRNITKEAAESMAVGAVFGGIGAKISKWKAAKDALKPSAANAKTALETAQELEQISDELAATGIQLKNGKMTLSPGQASSSFQPEGEILDTQLSTFEPVRKFFEKQGEMFAKGWDTLRHSIANATGKNADDLFSKVKDSAKISTQLEGKLIEEFRDQALMVSKGAPRAMPTTAKALDETLDNFGFRRVPGRDAITFQPTVTLKGPGREELSRRFVDASPKTLGRMEGIIREMELKMRNGNGALSLKDTDALYKKMRSFIDDNIGTAGGDRVAKSMINLKNQLRDDWTAHIGAELEQFGPSLLEGNTITKGFQRIRPNAFEDYTRSLAKYSDMKKAQETLANVLEKNDLSASAFANYIFSPTQGKDRVKQMKTLIQEVTPDLWDNLRQAKLNEITSKNISRIKGAGAEMTEVIDFKGIQKDLNALDKAEVLDDLLAGGGMGKAELRKFMTLAERVDTKARINPEALGSTENLSLVRRLFIAALPGTSMTAKVANITQLIGGMGKDKAVAKWLNGEGLELVLRGIPAPKRAAVRSLINEATTRALETEARMGVSAPSSQEQTFYQEGGM